MSKKIKLTISQTRVLAQIMNFIDTGGERVFILKGYAGTGKTTLLRFLLKELKRRNLSVQLMAPTGRAAKVMSNLASDGNLPVAAKTIHSTIYSFNGLNQDLSEREAPTYDSDGQMFLTFEPSRRDQDEMGRDMIYVIDEASMVSDIETKDVTQAKFGTGKLLTELLQYDPRPGSKFIFVGDPCQLPPVEQYYSPALMPDYFEREYGIHCQSAQLTEIMRQAGDSSIVTASKSVRALHQLAPVTDAGYGHTVWGKLPFRHSDDIHWHASIGEMIQHYVSQVKRKGVENAIFIGKSNNKCQQVSIAVRPLLGRTAPTVMVGDLLMVTQNNLLVPLVNGDMVVVTEVTTEATRCSGMQFRLVKVKELFSQAEHKTWLLEDLLYQDRPNLDKVQQSNLIFDFVGRMSQRGIKQKSSAFYDAMLNDVFLNALRCSWGYAVTCHKAQGGEWDTVYVDMPRNITMNPVKEKYQWVYTAMTRASRSLHLVNDFFYE
ncbi:MAG: AAA family ATPase [Muribaculaceae bacterium]|nr:AAA family ATPase [Muribaculaceae bacterium]